MAAFNDIARAARRRLWQTMPRGRALPPATWDRRHRGIVVLLALHIFAVAAAGIITGQGVQHSAAEAMLLAAPLGVAIVPGRRSVRASAATFGLITASALLVHLSNGQIEMHFHFFVMVGVVALYHDWAPFIVAVAAIVAHHAIVGAVAPASVYNHPAGISSPMTWSLIHGGFVLATCLTQVISWRGTEDSFRDAVTELPTSAALTRAADLAAERQRGTVALLFLDLDGFKGVNDQFGHSAGDHILLTAATRIREAVRASDTVCRLGGDEFAVFLPDNTEDGAIATATRIIRAMNAPVPYADQRVRIGCSVGIVVADSATPTSQLIDRADLAMYEAKRRGKGQYVVYNGSVCPSQRKQSTAPLHT